MTSILKYLNRALLVLLLAAFAACSDNEGGNESNGNGDDGNTETPADGDTYGYIKDTNGNSVEGVVVSDGYSCTATDAEGRYALTRNADAGFVFYSLPSAYKVSVDKTYKLPRFFARLQAGTARYDFTLEALAAPEKRFDLICIGDPQINEASHAVRFKEEAGREIREYAASAGVPCYGITLGDHVNNKWTLFTNMVVALQPEQTGVPVFATIGNHDHEFPTADEKAARAKYESYFGPVDYSFNRGDVHVVSMDNVIHSCKASADYEGGFTAAQYEWLKQDLSFVPKDKMVILCVHIPFRGGWGTNSAHADADKYYDEVLDLLEGRCTSGEEIRERRSCFLAHHDGKFNAVVIRLEHNTEMFRRFAYSTLQDLFPESLFILYRDSILFFANLGNIEQHLEDQASSILTRLSDYLEHANAYAGISIQFERLEQLRLAYVQAEHALETGRKLGG